MARIIDVSTQEDAGKLEFVKDSDGVTIAEYAGMGDSYCDDVVLWAVTHQLPVDAEDPSREDVSVMVGDEKYPEVLAEWLLKYGYVLELEQ